MRLVHDRAAVAEAGAEHRVFPGVYATFRLRRTTDVYDQRNGDAMPAGIRGQVKLCGRVHHVCLVSFGNLGRPENTFTSGERDESIADLITQSQTKNCVAVDGMAQVVAL